MDEVLWRERQSKSTKLKLSLLQSGSLSSRVSTRLPVPRPSTWLLWCSVVIPVSDQWVHTLPYSWCCLWRSKETDIFGDVHSDITSDPCHTHSATALPQTGQNERAAAGTSREHSCSCQQWDQSWWEGAQSFRWGRCHWNVWTTTYRRE